MKEVVVKPPTDTDDTGHRQVLVLHGGGYRGLYTARVLEKLEENQKKPVTEIFDMVAGTSIGGIIAMALASGKDAESIRKEIEEKGPMLFPDHGFIGKKWQQIRRVFGAPHDQEALKEMVGSVLEHADQKLIALTMSVVVPALDATGNSDGPKPVIYSNHRDSPTRHSKLIDVALATSAAPTYLPSYTPPKSRTQMVDGGVIANSPSWIAMTMATADYGWDIDKMRMLIVGTTKSVYGRVPAQNRDKKNSEGFGYWLTRGNLFELVMEGQQRLADNMCVQAIGNERCFSINSLRSRDQDKVAKVLNQASTDATETLKKLADEAAEKALNDKKIQQLLNRNAITRS